MYDELLKQNEADKEKLKPLLDQLDKLSKKDLEDLMDDLDDASGDSDGDQDSNDGDSKSPGQQKASDLADELEDIADELGVDYFTTVMTISRQKNSQILNEIGLELSKERKAKYFVSDFKKKKGIDRKKELIEEYDMYNQEYCGCVYSYSEYLTKLER